MLPRLALTGFTYSQAFFVEAMLNYLDDDAPMNNGIGLIGACALVYLGMAVSALRCTPSLNHSTCTYILETGFNQFVLATSLQKRHHDSRWPHYGRIRKGPAPA